MKTEVTGLKDISELVSVQKHTENGLSVRVNGYAKASSEPIVNANATCGHCHALMTSLRSQKEFCSAKCRMSAWRRRKKLEDFGIVEQPLCLHGSFQSYQQTYREKIDVIITDPPYGREYLPLYKDLATFALKALCPGGWLLCLTGWGLLWDIGGILNQSGLEYMTVCTYLIPSATMKGKKYSSTGARKWAQQAKPLLWYQKPGTKLDRRRAGTSDLMCASEPLIFVGENNLDRREFHWQQCVEGFKQIVWNFANPQDVICDPCMGSGTTLVAATLQNRRHVIGIEKDRDTFLQAEERVKHAETTMRKQEYEQQERRENS